MRAMVRLLGKLNTEGVLIDRDCGFKLMQLGF